MMNHNGPAIPMAPFPGRGRDFPYSAPSPHAPYPHPYHNYPPAYPAQQSFHPQPQPQYYAAYQHMQMQMPRHFQQQQYPPMPYPMHHNAAMPPRHSPAQHPQQFSSFGPHHGHLSPPPADRPAHMTPPMPAARPSPPAAPPPILRRMPFYPPLPWYSVPEEDFPERGSRRRRRRPLPQSSSLPVELPPLVDTPLAAEVAEDGGSRLPLQAQPSGPKDAHPEQAQPSSDTPTTSQAPSEADSTHPTTPSSTVPPRTSASKPTNRHPNKIIPIVPIVPNMPSRSKASKQLSVSGDSEVTKHAKSVSDQEQAQPAMETGVQRPAVECHAPDIADGESVGAGDATKMAPPPVESPPKSWADRVRTKAPTVVPVGTQGHGSSNGKSNPLNLPRNGSLSTLLSSFAVTGGETENKIAFLKPRGLVNTGNMCYMNSVLQILVFCVPLYSFLDQVGKQAVHRFKSDTPLVDAMIMFMREFSIIDSAVSTERLRMRLKDNELEQYGDAFTPEFVYEVIRGLPRFSSMRRGHQQDAEEFLGFLLEELHDECVRIMKHPPIDSLPLATGDDVKFPASDAGQAEHKGWLEVGHRQKTAVTRSSGTVTTESPITKIFGGQLRSELRVPGAINSVTLEPYQPLQLDIGSPHVNNITDALKGLTRPETLHGDFNSPRGPGVTATKQVFIETLPPVLILHLKRFQYDNTGGTLKIWKKVGYPLDLEIPKEVFPQHKRAAFAAHGGLPKYRLVGVVYHHGKNASGGHYTVDVRRQDGREWIRLDDTMIRRVRSEDVAEGGSEEDPNALAAALEQHKRDQSTGSVVYDQFREQNEDKAQAERGWSHVNGGSTSNSAPNTKKWSGVVNGAVTPTPASSGMRTPAGRFSVKDNKVAYLLFYQKTGP